MDGLKEFWTELFNKLHQIERIPLPTPNKG